MASLEEKLKLASQLLRLSPPGELFDILNDLRVLIGNDEALLAAMQAPLVEYNTTQFISLVSPDLPYPLVLCPPAQIDSHTFFDPNTHSVCTVDHLKQVVTAVKPASKEKPHDAQRTALDSALRKYVTDHYPGGACHVYVHNDTFHLIIVADKLNPNNFWNGRWRSEWTMKVGSTEVHGKLRANVHYYEDGNVQLASEKSLSLSFSTGSDADATASSIVQKIASAESDFQTSLNESYAHLSDSTFKTLRRALPITRNKIDWNKIMNYKVGAELGH